MALFAGWAAALAGCVATLVVGWHVVGALAFAGLLNLFRAPGAAPDAPGYFALVTSLAPAALAVVITAGILLAATDRTDGPSSGWLLPALLMSAAVLLFGVYVCIDVWPSASGARAP